MERVVVLGAGDGTGDAKAGMSVEQIVADNQARPAPALFVT
jgi:hypothetical protein